MKNKIILIMFFSFLLVGFNARAFAPLLLISFDVSETNISPNGDGIKDSVDIDIDYSEEVKADINILDSNGNKVRDIYDSNKVTNPQKKIWDGKDNSGEIVPDGLYTIEILGTAIADEANTVSDISKTVYVENKIEVTLSSISITIPASKLNYKIGENLEITGLEVTGTYNDNSTKIETITSDNITGFDSSVAVDNQVLTITLGEYTVTYSINISSSSENPSPTLTNISITKPAFKLDYKVGEVLDITGLEITGTYSDDSTKIETITISNITGFDSSTVISGQILTITVGGSTATYIINISKIDDGSSGGDTNNDIMIDEDVTIKSSCEVVDTDGVTHIFTDENSPGNFLAICALAEALEEGIIDELSLKNDSSFGLYVENINDIELSGTEYWAVWLNDKYTSCGVGCQHVLDGDTLSFILTDWMTETKSSKIYLNINISSNQKKSSSGGGSNSKDFSIEKAIAFLFLEHNKDESLGGDIYIDWVSVALGKEIESPLRKELIEYLMKNPIESSVVTENERRAMALMSLGINPYDGTEINYIKKITDAFNGTELDDDTLSDFNDDIFGLIVLQNAGYDEEDEMISKIISHIISKQSDDGSWGSVDMTGATIMALWEFDKLEGVETAISKAQDYLIESQNDDGGFDNISSTGWATQALSLDDSYKSEVKDGIEYIADNQNDDGGVNGIDTSNRIWATAYAVPAVLELSWIDILNEFDKPEELVAKVDPVILPKPVIKSSVETLLEQSDKKEIQDQYTKNKISEESLTNEIEDIEKSDLVASALFSTENNFIKGKSIVLFLGAITAIFLIGFVLRRKI